MPIRCNQCGEECSDSAKFCKQCGVRLQELTVDVLYERAVAIVLKTRRASISQIKRQLRIGYNQAALLIETMEKNGIVSPMNDKGSREVLIPDPDKQHQDKFAGNKRQSPTKRSNDGRNDADIFINKAFSNLIGMKSVLDEIRRQSNQLKIQKLRAEHGLQVPDAPSRHMVFLGPPGTGKTTVARIIAGLYYRLGLLSSDKVIETQRAGLCAAYVGQTAIQTKQVIESALGGVLFIDEAYTLVRGDEQDFGREAIDTLLKLMEDHRSDLVVIVAGYDKEMESFLKANPGLASRFNRRVHFPNYTPKELVAIFEHQFKSNDFVLEEGITVRIEPFFAREIQAQRERFGNARYVRNIFERTQEAQADRLANQGKAAQKDLQKISLNDVESALGERLPELKDASNNIDQVLASLNRLVGLTRVKEQITDLVDFVRVQRIRADAGIKPAEGFSLHLVFSGNPGTGKTTVARIIADIYFSLGLIPTNHLREVDRSGLVASYVGQTAQKTQEAIQEALGGILFIDEAYALTPRDPSGSDFGKEAVDTLLKAMEDYRSQFVVIVAGYKEQMRDFIDVNPGLRSRFNRHIDFDDYTPYELLQIFMSYCSNGDYVLQDAAHTAMTQWLETIHQEGGTDGNGRFARNLFERCAAIQARRVAKLHAPTTENLRTLTMEDVAIAMRETHDNLSKMIRAIRDRAVQTHLQEGNEPVIAHRASKSGKASHPDGAIVWNPDWEGKGKYEGFVGGKVKVRCYEPEKVAERLRAKGVIPLPPTGK